MPAEILLSFMGFTMFAIGYLFGALSTRKK